MLFNTIQFLIFLPVVIIFYYLLNPKYRWVLLLSASYYFYMCWKVEYVVLILASTLIDYFAGIQMEKQKTKIKKRFFLILSLLTNLGLLFSFKYFNFFTNNGNFIFENLNIAYQLPELKVLLPVGISFYTFQTLSYSVDVYHGRQKAEKHLGYFALYVSFFPQLVAGPIERFSRLTPQLKTVHKFSKENLINGLRLILFGLFAKMVIADNVSIYVDAIYKDPSIYSSKDILFGVFMYSFQIYCDFFGYSTIAIGTAKILGINLMDNFKTPYLAKNIAEFWQRWHISLSSWFRDYVYLPLGGNRVKWQRWLINILIVFTVSGIWHGANWTFVFWGCLFGVIYIIEKTFNKLFRINQPNNTFSIINVILTIKTFVLVSLIWIFFRSENIEQSFQIFKLIATNTEIETALNVKLSVFLFLGLFILIDIFLYNTRFDYWCNKQHFIVRWILYFVLIFSIIAFSGVEDFQFIYFQF
ncbi:MAG: MBOAT family protein [Bacteroidales bacterium]|nr:MBOAT family protein [Bacteroidales bacterium]